MRPLFISLLAFIIACSNIDTTSYEIDSKNHSDLINFKLTINIAQKTKEEADVSVQIFSQTEKEIENYVLVFDMKFRENYEDEFNGVCIGPSWEGFGSGEFTLNLEKINDYKSTITGNFNKNEDDRCKTYLYYLRFPEINTVDGEIYLIGVATDYSQEYPDAPHYWKVNKNNQIDGQGTTNIEKYSLNFELKK